MNQQRKYLSQKYKYKEDNLTHSWLSGGKFTIENDNINQFLEYYVQALLSDKKFELLETPIKDNLNICLVDFDLDYNQTTNVHLYDSMFLFRMVSVYRECLLKYIKINDPIDIPIGYIFEKEKNTIDNYDGIHIIFPKYRIPINILYKIREDAINILKTDFSKYDFLSCSKTIEDTIDKGVIYNKFWFLYGSGKPDSGRYELTYKYEIDGTLTKCENWIDTNSLDKNLQKQNLKNLINSFSIRYLEDKLNITDDMLSQDGLNIIKNNQEKQNIKKSLIFESNEDLYHKIKFILENLSFELANEYHSWRDIGMICHYYGDEYFDLWDIFSQKSPNKYKREVCLEKWKGFSRDKDTNYSIKFGTLMKMFKEDNPEKYYELSFKNCWDELNKLDNTDLNRAILLGKLFKNKFIYDSENKEYWYLENNSRWVIDNDNIELKKAVNGIGNNILLEAISYFSNLAIKEINEDKKTALENKCQLFLDTLNKIKSTHIKSRLVIDLKEQLHEKQFSKKLDQNCLLIGFENGVYDLLSDTFRKINPDDYITMSVRYDFNNIRDLIKEEEIMKYWSQVIRDDDCREFYLICLASCLEGINKEEMFIILSGVGSNSKGKSCELVTKTLGDYAGSIEPSYFQMFNEDPKAANPGLFNIMKCRFVSTTEPQDGKSKFNTSLIKRWTGRDELTARQLHRNPITMIPHFTPFIQLNSCPQMDDDSDGTLRRIVNVEFNSKFVPVPNPNHPHEFQIDTTLPDKFDDWRMSFFHILTDYYKKYKIISKNGGLKKIMPESIKVNSKALVFSEDPFRDWFEQNVKEEPNNIITLSEITSKYYEWFNNVYDGEDTKQIGKKEIKTKVSNWIGLKPIPQKNFHGKILKKYMDELFYFEIVPK